MSPRRVTRTRGWGGVDSETAWGGLAYARNARLFLYAKSLLLLSLGNDAQALSFAINYLQHILTPYRRYSGVLSSVFGAGSN